ncbi:geranylgeranyl transferase type-2 subunit alpha 1 [Cucurbita pepo subsp. pepo]|uniref:geranylgeranyl transferase type-2 subunit alpha 1 n=1 Tax=Cucurbita pepo subsp. pepo TaxID=3664 RepID=UPI000C9D71CF|nr:geranylgeranyl transferase type-2 subunit alpha 1 [Cucurbita pepo subsp. pepo]
MHGRPRKPQKPEEEEASAAEAAKLRPLQSQLLENHHQKNYDKEALEVSAKVLEMNPDLYTAWNYRKLAVEHYLKESPSDTESIKEILDEELRVAESALRQNVKSYGAWYHRKWILSKGHSSTDLELRLLGKFQKLDARNFHAWNYRRFVAELTNIPEEKELKYTTDMIDTNFSNYSAWHNRSALLAKLLNKKAEGYFPAEKVLSEEYELVHQAIFTDPDDQSGWFYHLWLLDQTIKSNAPSLVSSWPPHSYRVALSRNRSLDDQTLSPSRSFHSDSETLALILYFDQPVQGVDSSSVSVKSTANLRGDLIWKPLSKCSHDAAKAWVSHLSFPQGEMNSSESYSVVVSLGNSQKITSASGFHHVKPTCFSFEVSVHLGETPIEDCGNEGIWWKDENFTSCSISPQTLPFASSDNLTIENNYAPSSSEWCAEIISNEIALFRELLSETDCKIGKLTLARFLMAHVATSPHANKMAQLEEVLELYQDLMKLDPTHFHYYKDEHSLVLLQKVTSTMESLFRHCYCYKDQTSPYLGTTTCVRLNNLSISRIGSVERLLWVQVLDLSHNELRSTEGLEALQLLSCLSLSNNKIGSFTALESLRTLKSLKVLDVSCNEIGSHSIDTTRYLFSSPLSHSEEKENDLSSDKMVTDSPDLASYWEAYFLFKDLNLTQLDIEGNMISSERFKAFLVKVLPKLHWLDGKQVQ